jgi:cytochrome c553
LKLTAFALPTAIVAVAAAILASTAGSVHAAQQPAEQAPPPPPMPMQQHHAEPAPTNLQVLPKNMTGEQVHQIMHQWEAELGTECSTCHAADPKSVGTNGRPRLNFAADSKEEKSTARLMYRMTQEINEKYISMVGNSGMPVTCGTCHQGHLSPVPFVPKTEDHNHPPRTK